MRHFIVIYLSVISFFLSTWENYVTHDNSCEVMLFMFSKTDEQRLDPNILHLLGDESEDNLNSGDSIPDELSAICTTILRSGLSEETRVNLLKKYPAAINCPSMAAPKLNVEVKAAISEASLKRDERFVGVQDLLGASLSALGRSISLVLAEFENHDMQEPLLTSLGDSARLIAAVQCSNHTRVV